MRTGCSMQRNRTCSHAMVAAMHACVSTSHHASKTPESSHRSRVGVGNRLGHKLEGEASIQSRRRVTIGVRSSSLAESTVRSGRTATPRLLLGQYSAGRPEPAPGFNIHVASSAATLANGARQQHPLQAALRRSLISLSDGYPAEVRRLRPRRRLASTKMGISASSKRLWHSCAPSATHSSGMPGNPGGMSS